jgi:biopolymer transport protein ExbB
MHLTERLLGFMLLGSEWVLFVLLGLSVVSVAVMVERAIFLRARGDADALARELESLLKGGDVEGARQVLAGRTMPAAMVAAAGLNHHARGSEAMGAAMAGAKARLRVDMEKNLGLLGTLGNNAPFIGLFGTVLGIIKAFADLSRNSAGGANAVMAGISEALVATAVGLMVAIPAVIAFNYFQAKVRRIAARIDAVAHMVLATFTPAEGDTGETPVRAEAKA